jgi:hypothetical protein
MVKPLLPHALRQTIEPLLPTRKPRRFRYPGRRPINDRTVLVGIQFVVKSGIPPEDFPCEINCCGMTLRKRLCQWQRLRV